MFHYLVQYCDNGNNGIQYTAVLGLVIGNDEKQIMIAANISSLTATKCVDTIYKCLSKRKGQSS